MPTTAVVIPTFDRRSLLDAALRAIERLDPPPDEVVVVSDGSTDGSEALVTSRGHRLLRTTGRCGPATARNLGWRSTSADVVAFVDDDCAVEPGWLGALLAPFADRHVGLVQGCTVPAGPVGPWDRTVDVREERGLYESCNIAYRREALEAVGGFDEAFGRREAGGGRPLGEDTDLAWRVRRAGWGASFAAGAVVRHHVFPGSLADGLREEWRKRHFPWLVREIPELRDCLPAGRLRLRTQSVPAQMLLVGAASAATGRARAGMVLAAPYLWWSVRTTAGPRAAVRQAARDLVCSGALVWGSLRHGSLVL